MELLQPALTLCQYFIKSHLISKEEFLFSSVNHNILCTVYYSGINLQVGQCPHRCRGNTQEWMTTTGSLLSPRLADLRADRKSARELCEKFDDWRLEVISISRCQSNEQTACPSPRRWPWPWQRYLCFSIPHLGRYITLYLQLCFASLILMYI